MGTPMIEYHSLSDMTAERLRSGIIFGDITLGTRITETEIAQTFGVSRVVVREAILMLQREGLLIKERNRYTQVLTITPKDVTEILDLRIAIEQAAAKSCLRNPNFQTTILPQLERCSAQINEIKDPLNSEAILQKDQEFHHLLIISSDNVRLQSVWEELSSQMLVLLYRYISAGCVMHYSHDAILDAMRRGDLRQVKHALSVHIEETQEELIRLFQDAAE